MAKKLTKGDLIKKLSDAAKCSQKVAGDCLKAFLDEVQKALKTGKDVTLPGFGTFTVSKRKARTGRNPQTGATIKIPAKKVPRFKAGKGLKEAVK